MTRKPHKHKLSRVVFLLPSEDLAKIDAKAEEMAKEVGVNITRSDVVRRAISQFVR
jgi:hypothetical protein